MSPEHAGDVTVLRDMVFSLLSENERRIVLCLGEAAHPLSFPELQSQVTFSYRTLRRLVWRLEQKKIVSTYRDVIKVVVLNSVLLGDDALA